MTTGEARFLDEPAFQRACAVMQGFDERTTQDIIHDRVAHQRLLCRAASVLRLLPTHSEAAAVLHEIAAVVGPRAAA